MKFGEIEIYPVLSGFFRLDGGAMFGRVPKEIWKRTNLSDRQNRILLALRCLLIKTKKQKILIDTGIGNKHDLKFGRRFAIDKKINMETALNRLGFSPPDIDVVVNTHLHFDHCGGNTIRKGGKIIPAFPKAKYLIQKREFAEALGKNPLTKASYRKDDFMPLYHKDVIEFLEGDVIELEKGITLIKTGGHTKNHMIVEIESCGRKAIYLGDIVPTITHLKYPFIMGYDNYPLETLKRKLIILPQAARNHALLIFEHDPTFEAAYIKGTENGKFSAKPEKII
jgi:glyoxylase-like metal-dependent hydrolase (beta-lactamase superfamily II)